MNSNSKIMNLTHFVRNAATAKLEESQSAVIVLSMENFERQTGIENLYKHYRDFKHHLVLPAVAEMGAGFAVSVEDEIVGGKSAGVRLLVTLAA